MGHDGPMVGIYDQDAENDLDDAPATLRDRALLWALILGGGILLTLITFAR